MYCSNCGVPAAGNFCSTCGSKLTAASNAPPTAADWRDEVRYEVLLYFPEVRDLLARHAGHARKGMSGERFLELCDKAMAPLMGGVSISTVASVALPIYAQLGIHTGKKRSEVLAQRPGEAIVAVLCSLADRGQNLKEVQPEPGGCRLTAEIPSDMRSMTGGELQVVVRREERGTLIDAATYIPGQLYDWGKSTQTLAHLFEDLQRLPEGELPPIINAVAA